MSNVKRKYWLFEIYPDSAPTDFKNIIKEAGLPVALSPLHDKDLKEDGTPKKAHYHILVAYPNTTTYNNALNFAKKFGANIVIPCDSVKGSYEYQVHKNNPEKYQYNDSDRQLFNNFDIDALITPSMEEKLAQHQQILDIIYSNNFTIFTQLVFYLNKNKPSLLKLVIAHSYFYSKILEECRTYACQVASDNDTP